MSDATTTTGLQLRSLIRKTGDLELSLAVPTPEPAADEIVIRVEATPINPSDIGLLLGPIDLNTAKQAGTAKLGVYRQGSGAAMPVLAARLDQSMPVGNEGAGTVSRRARRRLRKRSWARRCRWSAARCTRSTGS